MSIDERRRIRIFEGWVDTWGQEYAEEMLELFPPPGRDVATSDDIGALGGQIAALDTKIDTTKTELEGQIAALDTKIDTTRTELELRIDRAVADLTAVFQTEIRKAVVTQTRITVFSMVTAFAAVSALALGLG